MKTQQNPDTTWTCRIHWGSVSFISINESRALAQQAAIHCVKRYLAI